MRLSDLQKRLMQTLASIFHLLNAVNSISCSDNRFRGSLNSRSFHWQSNATIQCLHVHISRRHTRKHIMLMCLWIVYSRLPSLSYGLPVCSLQTYAYYSSRFTFVNGFAPSTWDFSQDNKGAEPLNINSVSFQHSIQKYLLPIGATARCLSGSSLKTFRLLCCVTAETFLWTHLMHL